MIVVLHVNVRHDGTQPVLLNALHEKMTTNALMELIIALPTKRVIMSMVHSNVPFIVDIMDPDVKQMTVVKQVATTSMNILLILIFVERSQNLLIRLHMRT